MSFTPSLEASRKDTVIGPKLHAGAPKPTKAAKKESEIIKRKQKFAKDEHARKRRTKPKPIAHYSGAFDCFELPGNEFLDSDHGLPNKGGGWTGSRLLGAGGQGRAGLWIQVDQQNTVIDTMVVKESYLGSKFDEPWTWKDGAMYDVPREAYMNELVNDPVDSSTRHGTNNVKLLGSSVNRAERTYRIYQGFCALGGLDSVIKATLNPFRRWVVKSPLQYRVLQDRAATGPEQLGVEMNDVVNFVQKTGNHEWLEVRRVEDSAVGLVPLSILEELPAPKPPQKAHWERIGTDRWDHVPEPFLWFLFQTLSNALSKMESPPSLIEDVDGRKGVNVVHIDLKPDNIFLKYPNKEDQDWPMYPIPEIGDFGSAIMTHDNDPQNPDRYNKEPSTEGYKPLELKGGGPPTDNKRRLGPWTNIYQVGMTIYATMIGREATQIDYVKGEPPWMPPMDHLSRYSLELRSLVEDCVRPEPEDRITIRELRERVDGVRGSWLHTHEMYDFRAEHWTRFPFWLNLRGLGAGANDQPMRLGETGRRDEITPSAVLGVQRVASTRTA